MENINFETLLGETAELYYCNDLNRFQLGSVIFEVIENGNDGYRSYLEEVVIVNKEANKGQHLASVKIENSTNIDQGYQLTDVVNNFIWVEFGTNNYNDYYPYFVFTVHAFPPINISDNTEHIKSLIK